MKKSKEAKAISALAKHHDLSEEEIRGEMQHAIEIATTNANFTKIFGKIARPSPEEFIRIISDTIKYEAGKK